MTKQRTLALAALALSSVCTLQAAPSESGVMAYAVGGTGGLGGGLGYHFNDMFTVRGEIAGFNYNDSTTQDGLTYEGHLKISTQALYLDWHPMRGSYRFTVGLDNGRTRFGGSATGAGGTIEIDGQSFVAGPNDYIRADVRYPRFMPYLGVGWGLNGKGFNFGADLGVNFGSARVTLDASPGLLGQLGADAALAAQLSKYREDVPGFFPIAKISIGYSF